VTSPWAAKSLEAEKHQNLTPVKNLQPNHIQHHNVAMKSWANLGIRMGHATHFQNGE
jgi:hypothetical protein